MPFLVSHGTEATSSSGSLDGTPTPESADFVGDSANYFMTSLAPRWTYSPFQGSRSNLGSSGLSYAERGQITVAQPELIQNLLFPTSSSLQKKILAYRERFSQLLHGTQPQPLLVLTGPAFIEDSVQMKACAMWIGKRLGKHFGEFQHLELFPKNVANIYERTTKYKNLVLALRTNLSKYNSDTLGKSIMTFEMQHGIPMCRALLSDLAEICPIVGDISDTITPQYLSDLYSFGMVSSTLAESQIHRELVSGLSYGIGFGTCDSHLEFDKASILHRIELALDAMFTSSQSHQFLSVTKIGTVAVVGTVGNSDSFLVLRCELLAAEIAKILEGLYEKDHPPKVMLDVGKVSYENYEHGVAVLRELVGSHRDKILGVIIDSGSNYVPQGYAFPVTSNFDANSTNMEKLSQINRNFFQFRLQTMRRKPPTGNDFYEHLVTTDSLLEELEVMGLINAI